MIYDKGYHTLYKVTYIELINENQPFIEKEIFKIWSYQRVVSKLNNLSRFFLHGSIKVKSYYILFDIKKHARIQSSKPLPKT